jgi:autotransporter adhesin
MNRISTSRVRPVLGARRTLVAAVVLALACGSVQAAAPLTTAPRLGPSQRVLSAADVTTSGYFASNGAGDGSDDAYADGYHSVAVGANALASSDDATAIGSGAVAFDTGSTAVGTGAIAQGAGSLALGQSANTAGDYASAIGFGASASGTNAMAMGTGATAGNAGTIAIGGVAVDSGGTPISDQVTTAAGNLAMAFGASAQAQGDEAVAIGALSGSYGFGSLSVGSEAAAMADNATAIGTAASATGESSTAIGGPSQIFPGLYDLTQATGFESTAIGAAAMALNDGATAIGGHSRAEGNSSIAIGTYSYAQEANNTAIGYNAAATGVNSIAIGGDDRSSTWAYGTNSVAIGDLAMAKGDESVALGHFASVGFDGANSVALGMNSATDEVGVVTVGSDGTMTNRYGEKIPAFTRRITNVGAGVGATDAVNVGQLQAAIGQVSVGDSAVNAAFASAFGGGAQMGLTGFVPPAYAIQGTSYNNAGDAFAAVDGVLDSALRGIADIRNQMGSLPGGGLPGSGPQVPSGSGNGLAVGDNSMATDPRDTAVGHHATIGADGSVAVGSNATVSAAATNAVAVGADTSVTAASATAIGQGASATAQNSVALGAGSVADQANTVSVGAAGNQRRVVNVAAGTAPTDAANVSQVDQALATAKSYADTGDQQTLARANAYTDSKITNGVSRADFDTFRSHVDDQFHQVNQRLDRVGAMGTALSQMSMNTSGLSGENRVGVGAGNYGGQSAVAVGYQRAFHQNRASVSIGASSSGSESTVGVGAGMSW